MVAAVEAVAPACFGGCPQPTNATSACYLHCLFDTMIGNMSTGQRVGGMAAADIVGPFVHAFKVGLGRIVVSEIEAPISLVNLV